MSPGTRPLTAGGFVLSNEVRLIISLQAKKK